MTDCSFALNAISAPLNLLGGMELEPEKLILNGGSFYDFYETKDGRYFSVGSLEPPFRKALCVAIEGVNPISVSAIWIASDLLMPFLAFFPNLVFKLASTVPDTTVKTP